MQIDKLSLKQRRILSYIHLNAAASYDEIAKACATKSHIARAEVSKLLEAKIINPCIVVNYSEIGLQKYHVYFSISPLDEKRRIEFIQYLNKHPRIAWLCDFSGEFDFGMTFMATDIQDFDVNLRDLIHKCPGIITNRIVSVDVSWSYFGKKYIFNDQKFSKPIRVALSSKPIQIDDIDKAVLKVLSQDPFISQQQIAQKMNIPLSTINSRIKGMHTKKIIAGFVYWISYSKIKIHAYRVLIDFGGLTDNQREKLNKYCATHPNIVSLIFTLGSWDMELGIDLEDKYSIHSVISEIRDLIKSQNFSVKILLRYDDIKWNTICPGVF